MIETRIRIRLLGTTGKARVVKRRYWGRGKTLDGTGVHIIEDLAAVRRPPMVLTDSEFTERFVSFEDRDFNVKEK